MLFLCFSAIFVCLGFAAKGQVEFKEQVVVEQVLENCKSACILSRPIRDAKQKVTVEMMIRLVEIIDGDPKLGEFTLRLAEDYSWIDSRLSWPDSDVDMISLPDKYIWIPDIKPNNCRISYDSYSAAYRSHPAKIKRNGSVHWSKYRLMKVKCKFDRSKPVLTNMYACTIIYYSSIWNANQLDVTSMTNSITKHVDYVENSFWNLKKLGAKIIHYRDKCCKDLFVLINVTFHFTHASYFV
ncbi:DgyrCDS2260 [Dimorphilus gyrociliatus]|uniref:DgyrCDS2260 n=1 Tax=Dimorphilus gyrociliatus TaxID=2664684 RepID=A0A7I8VB13_9ANNE|nr:DgyrCDS2260 [Dimorphilus gyrociliatus]